MNGHALVWNHLMTSDDIRMTITKGDTPNEKRAPRKIVWVDGG